MPPSYLPARRRGAGLEFAEVAELILSSVSTQDTGLVNKWADANSVHRAGPLASLANLRHVLGGVWLEFAEVPERLKEHASRHCSRRWRSIRGPRKAAP